MRSLIRTHWPWLLVATYAVQVVAVAHAIVWHIDRPLPGLYPHTGPSDQRVHVLSTSVAGERVRQGRTIELLAINGRNVCETPSGPRCGIPWVRALLDVTPGATNHFVVGVPPNDAEHSATLPVEPGDWSAIFEWARHGLVMVALALVYAMIGIVVWRRNPTDPAALPFLLFSLCVASMLTVPWQVDTFTLLVRGGGSLSSWMVMPFLFLFAHSFSTRSDASRSRRFLAAFVFFAAFGTIEGAGRVLSQMGWWALRPIPEAVQPLLITGAVVGLTMSLHSMWSAARATSPLSQRRRARVLALAVALGFGFPLQWLIFRDWIFRSGYAEAAFWGLVASFAAFPGLIGYAMVRHRMFDLRIVVRQGLVYTFLSVALALAYVAVVVGAYDMAGIGESTSAPVVGVVVVAVLFGVIRVRLERWIDAMVFRGREAFRTDIERVGKALGQARYPGEVASALQPALLSSLRLSRAYVLERDPETESALCHPVGNRPDPETGRLPPLLPPQLALPDNLALRLCFERAAPVYSVDTTVPDKIAGGSLWERYGLEVSVPFGVAYGDEPAGLLLLGPKETGRPFDPEEISLVEALGSQVAMALASARAFERLAESGQTLLRLTQGIVHEVNTPLGALGSSVDTLERAIARLVKTQDPEQQKRAMRGAHASITTVRTGSDRIKTLIGDLEAYINLEETERAPTDLCACLSEIAGDTRRTTGHAVNLEGPREAFVDGYPTRLHHVFVGIVDNAVTATMNGEPIHVGIRQEGSHWRVTVVDAGCGMSPEVLARVFEFGISKKRKQARMGLRIGLPYARRVVESLGGRITIRSQPGVGTEVRISLPALVQRDEDRDISAA